jgi:hypothetical protein
MSPPVAEDCSRSKGLRNLAADDTDLKPGA